MGTQQLKTYRVRFYSRGDGPRPDPEDQQEVLQDVTVRGWVGKTYLAFEKALDTVLDDKERATKMYDAPMLVCESLKPEKELVGEELLNYWIGGFWNAEANGEAAALYLPAPTDAPQFIVPEHGVRLAWEEVPDA